MAKMKYTRFTALIALVLTALVSSFAEAEEVSQQVRTEPLEIVQSLTSEGQSLDLETFIGAAFIFSGAEEAQVASARAKLAALLDEARRKLPDGMDPRERAEQALTLMHEELLVRYDERQTRLDVLLERGAYNCVSSGVLYAILVKALGLEVWGVRTVDHAFCRVQAGREAFDVETTSPFGFDPGTRKSFKDSFGKVTGYSYVPPSNYRDRRDIGERELLGLILFNRTAFSSDRKQYEQAVPPAVDAFALLEDEESYDRMITAFHNLASWYGMGRDFQAALNFLSRVAARYQEPRLDSLRGDLLHNWVLNLVQKGKLDQAEALLDARLADGELSAEEWKSLTVYLYQLRAQRLARTDFSEAVRIIEQGLEKVGSDRGLDKSYEVYVHNTVVTLVRAGRYQDALSILEQALERAPKSAVLLEDRKMIVKQTGGE